MRGWPTVNVRRGVHDAQDSVQTAAQVTFWVNVAGPQPAGTQVVLPTCRYPLTRAGSTSGRRVGRAAVDSDRPGELGMAEDGGPFVGGTVLTAGTGRLAAGGAGTAAAALVVWTAPLGVDPGAADAAAPSGPCAASS